MGHRGRGWVIKVGGGSSVGGVSSGCVRKRAGSVRREGVNEGTGSL